MNVIGIPLEGLIGSQKRQKRTPYNSRVLRCVRCGRNDVFLVARREPPVCGTCGGRDWALTFKPKAGFEFIRTKQGLAFREVNDEDENKIIIGSLLMREM